MRLLLWLSKTGSIRRAAAGHITGCELFAGRVRNISFKRTVK
jgi:hypothetical protein